jgi:hypothetical protein
MTYQRPAYEEVRIALDGNVVTLRPTLRAAITLEARFGFPALYRALEEGSFTIISEIILAASSPATNGAVFLSWGLGKAAQFLHRHGTHAARRTRFHAHARACRQGGRKGSCAVRQARRMG